MVLDSNFAFRSHVHDRQFAAEFATATPERNCAKSRPVLELSDLVGLAMGCFLLNPCWEFGLLLLFVARCRPKCHSGISFALLVIRSLLDLSCLQ